MNNLDIITNREVEIKINEWSNDVILVDGNDKMYFKFCLNILAEGDSAYTSINIEDDYHANIKIATPPNSIAKSPEPIEIGTYGSNEQKLFISFSVAPPILKGENDYIIKITFFIEDNDGTK